MPSELTALELSKLDLLDKNNRSLPPCFQEVTVAPNRLLRISMRSRRTCSQRGLCHAHPRGGGAGKYLNVDLLDLGAGALLQSALAQDTLSAETNITHRLGSQSNNLSVVLNRHFGLLIKVKNEDESLGR
jgi:hypothetical protein